MTVTLRDDSLSDLRRRMFAPTTSAAPTADVQPLLGYTVRINDGPNFYMLCKDIFRNRIYHFDSPREDPFILDCGGNIGMSVLYFKHVYPKARIITFEPDPAVLPCLRENVERNDLSDVTIVEAAIGGRSGSRVLCCDGKYDSALTDYSPSHSGGDPPPATPRIAVDCVRLRDYLTEPVDFLKVNIEGAETEVLADSEDRLRRVAAMAIEYHHLPGLRRTLPQILALLDRRGFDYLVYDYDAETNPRCQPPFRLDADTRYYLLIHARRRDA